MADHFLCVAFTDLVCAYLNGDIELTVSTHPVVAERAENPMSELSFRHRASNFGLLIAASFCFRKRGAAAFAGLPDLSGHTRVWMNGTPVRLAKDLEDLLTAAGVQAAGGGGGGQAVGVPVVGQLLLES